MTNRKLIRYAIASEKIREVARAENWGVGSPMSYQLELADDYANYASRRSGLTNVGWGGCGYLMLSSLVGAVSAAALGAIFTANGDHGLMAKILYKTGAGIGGLIGGGVLAGAISLATASIDDKAIENITKERAKRRNQRGIKGISEAQKKSACIGLVASESDRFDAMTGNRFPKPNLSDREMHEQVEGLIKKIEGEEKNE